MRIGTLKQARRNRINFKTWVKENWSNGMVKELEIIRIFLPGKFQNFTLICLDKDNNLEIARSLSVELGKQLLRNFKLSIKTLRNGTLYLKIDGEGNQDVIEKPDKQRVYIYENNSFVLRNINEIPVVEDDIPF
jgi:hypothetical protein